jgi:vacuolar protein sorting-associated protein 54
MLRDVEFFQSRLGKFDGFEDAGDHLLNIVKSKKITAPEPVPDPAPPAPAPAPAAAEEGDEGKKPAEENPASQPQAAAGPVEKNGEAGDASKA